MLVEQGVELQDHLVLESKEEQQVTRIQVFDALGRLQETLQTGTKNNLELNASTWAPGMYVVMIEADGQVSRIKVVKSGL